MPPATPRAIASLSGRPSAGPVTPRAASRRVRAAVSGWRPWNRWGRPGSPPGRRWERAVVYDSPVRPMRARTSRLKSLSVGMTQSSVGSRGPAPQQPRPARPEGTGRRTIRECAPLCLSTGPAGVDHQRLGAGSPPPASLPRRGSRVKAPKGACALAPDGQAGGGQALLDLGDGELAEV